MDEMSLNANEHPLNADFLCAPISVYTQFKKRFLCDKSDHDPCHDEKQT